MIDLHRFSINPFDGEKISAEDLQAYASDHLANLTSNNPGGVFNGSVTATNTLLVAVGGSVSSESVQLGIQMARTQAKNDFRAGLSNELSKLYGAVHGKYGKTGAVLRAIFPGGLRKALVTALGNHTTDLTASSEDGGTGPFRYVGDDLRLGHRWKGGQGNRGGGASQGNRRSATTTFQESAGSGGGVPESAGKGETLLPAEPAGRPSSREIARDQKSWRGSGSVAKRLTAM